MHIKYNDLPRKTKKGLKRALKKTIDSGWRYKNIKIVWVKKRSPQHSDYKGYDVTGYLLK